MSNPSPCPNRTTARATWPRWSCLIEPRSQHRINPDLVTRTLGLTPMESRIAVGLAEGKSVRELAAATGRTPGAISWHLKQIYRRQPISGQVDLVRLVLSLTEFE